MRRFTHIALALVVFLAGLAAGAWFSIGRRAAAFSAGVEQRLTASAIPAPLPEQARAFPSEEEMLTTILSAIADDEPLLRAHRLHDALARLKSAELAVLFERAGQIEDRERRDVLLGVLLTRWIALDPAAADAAVRPFRDRLRKMMRGEWRSLDTAVCQAWAEALPERALAEAMAAPEAHWARTSAWAAIRSLAEGDPIRQLESLARLPANRLRGEMCETAIRALAEKDSTAAEVRLDLLPEPRQRARVLSEILGKLAERDPAAGLARLSALAPDLTSGTDGIRLLNAVLRAAAKQDPASALAAAQALPEELQTRALGPALVGWAGDHPTEALTWAVENGVELSDAKALVFFGDGDGAGWNSLLSTAFQSDSAKTLAWLRTQPASPERDAMLREGIWSAKAEEKFRIYAELTPTAQAAAAEQLVHSFRYGDSDLEPWVKAQPPGAARQAAIQAFGAYQANNTPERIEALANAWPAGPDRDAAMRGIASSLSYNDPRRALDFARRVADPDARSITFSNLAQSWLYRDAPAARAWIASAPELSAGEKRVLLRQADER